MATLNQIATRVEPYGEQRSTPISPIRMLRAINNLSAAQLARLADVDRSTIRRLELGIGNPQARTSRKIAAVLDCPINVLFPQNDVEPAGTGSTVKERDDAARHPE